MVATTSRIAYEELCSGGKAATQRARILHQLLKYEVVGLTRRQIGALTHLELGAVAGRVNELAHDGLVVEDRWTTDPTTQKLVKLVRVAA